ncbi:L-threonylcarbamoyladenylate synthase [Streptomyces sp. XM83C]|jgi:L-threonylcarbamoyladenylate synthase|uniref:L-threonylcarbamoyladenylate synthase n=1 Tax=Streptomyces thermocoprophilus TaxID=78356 RepID=A0ABV5VG47_9ACTN|nr:L-threonylcarbamoyladenylate synthase [Streptomyces sp. XM83C]MCK1821570.1 L-threonylcarbamoyladenylate synthase [Streptomyces sp. XM83C]
MTVDTYANVAAPTDENLRTAGDLVRNGGVVVAPSDTNLALTLDPWNRAAVERAFAIKRRPPTSPLTLFVRHPQEWEEYTEVPAELREAVRRLTDAFWPGPFNIVLPRNHRIPDHLVCGGPTVALGCLSNPTIQRLIEFTGKPVAMTSANLSGQADGVLVDLDLAVRQIGDAVDMVIRGEKQGTTASSTIVTAAKTPFEVLRLGDITHAHIKDALGDLAHLLEDAS